MIYAAHDYQKYATQFIIDNQACALMLDMGLGKSVVTLTAISDLLKRDVKKVLVIAPLRVAQNTWTGECEKWEHLKHLRISKILGSEIERIKGIQTEADIFITNRENVDWLTAFLKNNWFFDMVILDELSSFKSPTSKRFKALRKFRTKINRVVGLTGTPVPNGLIDLWSQIYLLDKGRRLGRTLGIYRDAYFLPDKRNQQIIYSYKLKIGAEDLIYQKISDICISMKVCDYLDMPDRIDNTIEVQMTKSETQLYEKLKAEMILSFPDGDIDAVNAATLSNKLLQMANGAVYDENGGVKLIHDRKLEALEDLIEAANDKSVLIAYWFKHDLQRISERFTVEKLDTIEDIVRWNKGDIPIAVIHPASSGHGLNLQAGGSTLIWFGLTWSLELYQQTNARLWRQGQSETVVIHHIVTKDTIDEDVLKALAGKENTQAALIKAVKMNLKGGLS